MSGRTIFRVSLLCGEPGMESAKGTCLVTRSAAGYTLAAPPERVSRTLVGGNLGTRAVALDRNSSIAYDAREHRFVNTNSAPTRPQGAAAAAGTTAKTGGRCRAGEGREQCRVASVRCRNGPKRFRASGSHLRAFSCSGSATFASLDGKRTR